MLIINCKSGIEPPVVPARRLSTIRLGNTVSSSIESRISISRALKLLAVFRDMDADMPMGEAVSLLLIAQGETKEGGGLTVTDLRDRGEFALSSASRYMRALAKKDRHGRPGQELVADSRDPLDERKKVLRLTPKGRRVIEQINTIVGG